MAGIPSPRSGVQRLLRRPFIFDLPIAIFGTAGACVGAWNAWTNDQPGLVVFLAAAALATVVTVAFKVGAQWTNHEEEHSLHPIEGALHVLHAAMRQFDENGQVRIRATVHKPCGAEFLEQLTDYVGDDSDLPSRGRKFNNRCGIIGFAFRRREPLYATRRESDYPSFLKELTTTWLYDEREARNLRPDTYSWMAIPLSIPGSEKVSCIVYCDATQKHFFDDPQLREIAGTCCGGLSQFVEKHYPSKG